MRVSTVNENRLGVVLKLLFPTAQIVRRVRKGASIASPLSGRWMEVDFWVMQYSLAFEFQEAYHFTPSWYSITLEHVQRNDTVKSTAMKSQGRTLVQVPFWWDGTAESLAATILLKRPDLEPVLAPSPSPSSKELLCEGTGPMRKFMANATPIPDCPPDLLDSDTHVPWIGRLTMSTRTALLKPANVMSDLFRDSSCRWWISEKYDGVRICWVHPLRRLYSRIGHVSIGGSSAFQRQLNNIDIDFDGELWFGRGLFHEAQLAVGYGEKNKFPNWCYLRFLLYDCPSPSAKNLSYEDRYYLIYKKIGFSSFAEVAPHMTLTTKLRQLESTIYDNILAQKGAGLMFKLAAPSSAHSGGLAFQLKARRIMSGVIVGIIPSYNFGKERDSADCIFVLELSSGIKISATLGYHKRPKPQLGDTIDIAINSHVSDGPISADLLLVRHGSEDTQQYTRNQLLSIFNGVSQSACKALLQYLQYRESADTNKAIRHRHYGYWTEEGGKNIKLFFDSFAKRNNLGDPLNPKTWYLANTTKLRNEASFVRHHYGGSIETALLDAYPNIGLNSQTLIKENYWKVQSNRKDLFDRVAQGEGFNPTGTDHKWYRVTREDVMAYPGGAEVLDIYGGSIIMGLSDVYPALKLNEDNFDIARNYWHRAVHK